ncbi:MAG: thiamine phosphate synthase [Planctomycetota bacterium]|nr:MAG: thiamine phosphate synthase [Planctomycetota bacterium]
MMSHQVCAALACYVVVDGGLVAPEAQLNLVETLCRHGATMIQLRDKQAEDRLLVEQARRLMPICRRFQVPLLLNDRWHLVQEAGADGVHLGADDGALASVRLRLGPGAIIGRSIDVPDEAMAGHDYFGLGPIFPTVTKLDAGPVVGLKTLAAWRSRIPGPLVAIGGIDAERAEAVIHAGADGVAVVGAVCLAADPGEACAKIRQAVERGLARRRQAQGVQQ